MIAIAVAVVVLFLVLVENTRHKILREITWIW